VLFQRFPRASNPLRRLTHVLADPRVSWVAFVIAFWAWHIPALYDRGLRSDSWHHVQHACFFATILCDVEVHVRFLVALPLLMVAELVVHQRMRPIIRQFVSVVVGGAPPHPVLCLPRCFPGASASARVSSDTRRASVRPP
jgi:Cytochrome c oxidase caa3 assembly factor (Caa3_CtaG)